jgi:hypothetical protein
MLFLKTESYCQAPRQHYVACGSIPGTEGTVLAPGSVLTEAGSIEVSNDGPIHVCLTQCFSNFNVHKHH